MTIFLILSVSFIMNEKQCVFSVYFSLKNGFEEKVILFPGKLINPFIKNDE